MFVLLKNVSLKIIRTHENPLSFVFCYILELQNFPIERRNLYETFRVNF